MAYKFTHLFNIEQIAKEDVPINTPFKFKFTPIRLSEKVGKGAGIYLIHDLYLQRLIYIGMHNNNAPFHRDRIRKHLGSMTFRQKCAFGLNSTANNAGDKKLVKKIFINRFKDGNKGLRLYELVKENLSRYFFRVGGGFPQSPLKEFVAGGHGDEISQRRFQYACAFWDFFGEDSNIKNERFDDRFMFSWIDLNQNIMQLNIPDNEVTTFLKKIERGLIREYNPLVNNECDDEMKLEVVPQDYEYNPESIERQVKNDATNIIKNL